MRGACEIYGHRGAGGYFPENTLTGFIEAVKMGVQWLEFDVIISKDKKVVVSHEPWMNSSLCTSPNGERVKRGRKLSLFQMSYSEIKKYDCGKRKDKKFPKQKSVPSYKPLLSEVFSEVEAFISQNKLPEIKYCIEVKSFKILEGKFQPTPEEFARLVYEAIKENKIEDRVMVISFDRRILRHFQKFDRKIKTGLTFVNLFSIQTNIKKLGFTPYAFNPYHKLITRKMIRDAHESGITLNAWTVNGEKRMEQLIHAGVDGIMSDYPDVALNVLRTYNRISAS